MKPVFNIASKWGHIRSAFDGWYCDSDWGGYVVDEPQYASQFEIAGGVAFRF